MTCSEDSTRVGEALAGTATASGFWLVVEQSGPYAGREAAVSSGLPHEVGRGLLDSAEEVGGKVLLVRSPGRHPSATGPRRVWWCFAKYPRPVVWTAEVADPWDVVRSGRDPGRAPVPQAVPVDGPVALVCTHGRRDACCARRGRTLLTGTAPMQALWESSHQGGHRFAPVVLELTTGYQHGRVTADDLDAIVERAHVGEVHLRTARGHVGLPSELQAVDLAVRRAATARTPQSITRTLDGIEVDLGTERLLATVSSTSLPDRPESCGADPVAALQWQVELSPAPL